MSVLADPDLGPDEPRALAAEYVLGLLAGDDLRAGEQRLASNPAFAAEVADWWERLGVLIEESPSVEPRPSLWPRIAAALDAAAARTPAPAVAASAPQTLQEPGPPQPRRARNEVREPGRRAGVGRLLAAALAGAVAAGVAVAGFVTYREQSAPRPQGLLLATLTPENGEALYVAALDPARQSLVVTPTRVLPSDDRARELWIIPEDGTPRSVGLLSQADQPSAVALDLQLFRLAQTGVTLAVSLEDPGGSPSGAPQGPIIATGELIQVG